jgi:hypothetical protein
MKFLSRVHIDPFTLNEKKIKGKTDSLRKDVAAGPAGIRLKLLKVLGDNIRKSYY